MIKTCPVHLWTPVLAVSFYEICMAAINVLCYESLCPGLVNQ